MTAPTTRETADHAELAALCERLRSGRMTDGTRIRAAMKIESLLSEIAALRGAARELDAVSGAIGTVRFMDPPDGGDVPLSEQVRRMSSAITQAERQRDELRRALEKTASDFREVAEAHTQALDLLHLFDDHLGEDEPMWTDDSTVTGEWIGSDGIRHSLTFGMFRRIRAFLAPRGAE